MGDPIRRTNNTPNRPAAGARGGTARSDRRLSVTATQEPAKRGFPPGLAAAVNRGAYQFNVRKYTKQEDQLLNSILEFPKMRKRLKLCFDVLVFEVAKCSFDDSRGKYLKYLENSLVTKLPRREEIRENDPAYVKKGRDGAEDAIRKFAGKFNSEFVDLAKDERHALKQCVTDVLYYCLASDLAARQATMSLLEGLEGKAVSEDDDRFRLPLLKPQEIECFCMDVAQLLYCRHKDRL